MLSYSEQLSLQLHGYPGPGPGLVVAAPRLASLFSRPGPPDVTQQLAEYQEWLERVHTPQEEEIMYCAQFKAGPVTSKTKGSCR